MIDSDKIVIIIPTYNNNNTIADIINRTKIFSKNIIVVNDGSTDSTSEILSEFSDVDIISYAKNKGKGNALKTGLKRAYENGYEYAITIDSDGQHFPEDIPLFINAINQHPNSLIIGARNLSADNMPGKNTLANKFSNFWFWAETGQHLADTQSGFRLYPIKLINKLNLFTLGYEFEVEVIVKAVWKSINVINIPVRVYYPPKEERISHFKPLKDFTRISILNTYLFILAILIYHPYRFFKLLSWRRIKLFFINDIYHSKDTNLRIALSIGLGIFMGIVPIWGYQMIVCLFLAHMFKLSKTISIIFSNISIPPMIPFILFGSYAMGCMILKEPIALSFQDISFETVLMDVWSYIIGSVALAFAASIICFFLSWGLLSIFRKK